MAEPQRVDFYTACAPCQPYSTMRVTGPEMDSHSGYNALFGITSSVMSQIAKLLPTLFLLEQVLGFEREKANHERTPKDEFIARVLEITRPGGEQHFVAYVMFRMDSGIFIHGSRPRHLGPRLVVIVLLQ